MSEQNHLKKIGDDLIVSKVEPRSAGGIWVIGTVAGHEFEALVFPAHARVRKWEIGDSCISKLCIRRSEDGREVFAWERGPYKRAEDEKAQAVVDFLTDGRLREVAYPDRQPDSELADRPFRPRGEVAAKAPIQEGAPTTIPSVLYPQTMLDDLAKQKYGSGLRFYEAVGVYEQDDPRRLGVKLTGTIAGHVFSATIFPKHPPISDWDIGASRISRLVVSNDRTCVFNWNRGVHERFHTRPMSINRETMKRLSLEEKARRNAIVEHLISGVLMKHALEYQIHPPTHKTEKQLQRETKIIKQRLKRIDPENRRSRGQEIKLERDRD